MPTFSLSDFDFDLPEALVAQYPLAVRSASRLLDGRTRPVVDRGFTELPDLLGAKDLLVFNDTQVVKARLWGRKSTGGLAELLVERVLPDGDVAVHLKVSKKPQIGASLVMDGGFQATLRGRWPDESGHLFRFTLDDGQGSDAYALMAAHGHMPLPPYIERADSDEDQSRYQTVFAKAPGAVAAPTAALHFDESVLARLRGRGIEMASVTLHVGAGTFMPVKTEVIDDHTMHHERYWVPPATQAAIDRCRARGGRVVAVGTTTVRTLESWAATGQAQGDTNIFIRPGFEFRVVDDLITNFHLPKSTLLMLVSALTGYHTMRTLYDHAIAQGYRFFSYGDAMLLSRQADPTT